MAKLGYARISTNEQFLDLQLNALKEVGCERVYTDQGVSGAMAGRPGLDAAIEALKPGDTLVTWRLDRLGRSLQHIIDLFAFFSAEGVHFRSLYEAIDTSNAAGKLLFHIVAAIAEFERDLIVERTKAGLEAARQRGVRVGRPRALSPADIERARQQVHNGEMTIPVAAKKLGVGRTTLWRALQSQPE